MSDINKIRKRINFRELGGYPTADGRKVKHGIFYRCGALGELNEEEREIVATLGLKGIYDFRSSSEAAVMPDPAFEGTEYYHLSAVKEDPAAEEEKKKDEDMSPEAMQEKMLKIMLSPESERWFREHFYGPLAFSYAYQIMFDDLRKGKAPIAFHCSAGKDRTGIAAILILLALGVDYETALDDYMKTNDYRQEQINALYQRAAGMIAENPAIKEQLSVFEGVGRANAEYAMSKVLEKHGTFEKFFEEQFGLDEKALQEFRDMYTER